MRRHHQQHTQPQNTSQMNLISEEAIAIGQHNIKMKNQTKSSKTHVAMTHRKHRMFIKKTIHNTNERFRLNTYKLFLMYFFKFEIVIISVVLKYLKKSLMLLFAKGGNLIVMLF